MSHAILTVSKEILWLPISEIARYMGARSSEMDAELIQRVNDLIPRFLSALRCKACYTEVPVVISGKNVTIGPLSVESEDLAMCLKDCDRAIMFAATIGVEADRLRRIASVASPLNHLIYDALGSAAIEVFCDALCREWAEERTEFTVRPRYSPGYGDLSLEVQGEFLRALDAQRKIGLTLSDNLLMIPQKSVTAIVGLKACD